MHAAGRDLDGARGLFERPPVRFRVARHGPETYWGLLFSPGAAPGAAAHGANTGRICSGHRDETPNFIRGNMLVAEYLFDIPGFGL